MHNVLILSQLTPIIFLIFLGVRLDRVRGGRQKYRRCQESPYQVHPIAYKKPSLEGRCFLPG